MIELCKSLLDNLRKYSKEEKLNINCGLELDKTEAFYKEQSRINNKMEEILRINK